ncbi:hypothetical protein [Tateyamaria sp.]|uniref:hypothetical protein n=1 Tax=Tateyamaria sp. TaxID=1929288 RepID=UPI00329D06B8
MLACLPGAASAEVCDKVRPYWDGSHINMFEEVIGQLTNPFAALIVVLSILFVLQRKLIFLLFGTLLICVYALFFTDPLFLDDVNWAAKQEGCIGNQEVWWATLAGIGLFGLIRASRKMLRGWA